MKSVIYLDNDEFRIAEFDEWQNLTEKYKLANAGSAKTVEINSLLFAAVSNSFDSITQELLRELYYGN